MADIEKLPTLDPFSKQFTIRPELQLKPIRENDPVHFVESMNSFFLTRHADVKRACSDPLLSQRVRDWEGYRPPVDPDPCPTLTWISEISPFLGDKHILTRRMLTNTFTPRAIRRIENQIKQVVHELAGPLRQGGVLDIVQGFTHTVPNTVISRIIGIPPMGDDEHHFRELAVTLLRNANPLISPEEKKSCNTAADYLLELLQKMIAERKAKPKDDLISDLLRSIADEPLLNEDHIRLTVLMLISAGSDTAAQGSNFAVKNLIENPDQLELLRNDRALMDNAVKELLRYDAPGKFVPRFALEDVQYGDKLIKKGQAIYMSLQAANWDPAVIPNPDKLDITRDASQSLSFGHGPHFCVGAHLAKTEIACILNEVLDNFGPNPKVLTDQIVWDLDNIVFRTIESLPVDTDVQKIRDVS